MNGLTRFLGCATLGMCLATVGSADTLELKDGRVLQGKYLGGTQAILRFEMNGEVQTFRTLEIVALTFTRGSGNDAPPPPQSAPDNPPPAGAPDNPSAATAPPSNMTPRADNSQGPAPAQNGFITLPIGQPLLVRMIDGVDSAKNQVGDVFHASLETDLYVDNNLVARKGTDVYGRLAYAKEAGHFSGSSELQLELTRLIIDGKDYPLLSSDYDLKGKGRGSDTAKKVGGGAVAGAIIGAIAGGGKGAAIGAGAGSAVGAGVQVFTRGKQVKVPSETLLEFRLQQPAAVAPTQR
jgi:hypothetical protein